MPYSGSLDLKPDPILRKKKWYEPSSDLPLGDNATQEYIRQNVWWVSSVVANGHTTSYDKFSASW